MRLKQFLLCMLALMGSVVARAYELDVNGIYYNIIDAWEILTSRPSLFSGLSIAPCQG